MIEGAHGAINSVKAAFRQARSLAIIIDVDKEAVARVERRQMWARKQNGDGPRKWRIFAAGVGLAENSCDQLVA